MCPSASSYVFFYLSGKFVAPCEDDITVLVYVAFGIVRSSNIWILQGGVFCSLWSLRRKYNFSHASNFANLQTRADRLWKQEHVRGAECCSVIDYSCCSSWALSILMWQKLPQTVNRCLAVNDTINNLFVNIVYMDTVAVAFKKYNAKITD